MSSSKSIAKNTLFLYFRMFLTMGLQLYTSRVVLNVLGVDDYGIYSVVGGVVALFGFFNAAMSSATQRFLAVDIGKDDEGQLHKTFNTTFIIHLGIALLVLLIAETLGVWYLNNWLVVNPQRMGAVYWLYHFSVLAALIGIVQVPFNALIIVREQMKVYAMMSIVEVILKLSIVYLLLIIAYDKLILYGFLVLCVTLLIAIAYCVYCYKNFKESNFAIYKDLSYYSVLISYSGWNLFGNIASVAKGQGTNVLLNLFFGTVVNAAYGIMLQIQIAVNSFVTNFQMAVNPQIYKTYAQGNLPQMQKLMFQAAKFSYFLMYLLICPIIFNITFILVWWLKSPPEFTDVFVNLALINLLIECISGPIITASLATGKIKWYQIVVGSTLFLNLPLSYLFFRLGYSSEYFLYIAIGLSLLTLLLRLQFLRSMINLDVLQFVRSVIFPIIIVTLLSLCFLWGLDYFVGRSSNFQECFMISVLMMFVNAVIILVVGLGGSEKTMLFNLVRSQIKR